MEAKDLETLVSYQMALFTALSGVLVGKGLIRREELEAALLLVAEREPDPSAQKFLRATAEAFAVNRPASASERKRMI
ncbi:hypothetical protein CA606_19160 [Caulobacter vibrioides]|uniref:Uncharacterized protein n=1 Tax=Caulobacter vibrioides TaxID=155892 RepID=A0A290N2T1_CAUVI|nr:hypothetical protein [Caulobacter vibrioides]ATC34285.1 hypothetical protein CA606_19160 [Caulobacter vibrioides]